jgi:hypothetical protein
VNANAATPAQRERLIVFHRKYEGQPVLAFALPLDKGIGWD